MRNPGLKERFVGRLDIIGLLAFSISEPNKLNKLLAPPNWDGMTAEIIVDIIVNREYNDIEEGGING